MYHCRVFLSLTNVVGDCKQAEAEVIDKILYLSF
jgi:hypothetical protein